jgi:hypothetical protein
VREDCLSHDAYDLESAVEVEGSPRMGDLLADARERLGAGAVLDLEREIATVMVCATCDAEEAVYRPLDGLTVGAALCPECGAERRVTMVHAITDEDAELLALTPEELGLPPFDVVTGRRGTKRHHYLVGGTFETLADLQAA